jgi:hypothetical protein
VGRGRRAPVVERNRRQEEVGGVSRRRVDARRKSRPAGPALDETQPSSPLAPVSYPEAPLRAVARGLPMRGSQVSGGLCIRRDRTVQRARAFAWTRQRPARHLVEPAAPAPRTRRQAASRVGVTSATRRGKQTSSAVTRPGLADRSTASFAVCMHHYQPSSRGRRSRQLGASRSGPAPAG